MPPDPAEPPIRPLSEEQPPPAGATRWAAWLAVVAGLVGATVGLLIGVGIGSDPEPPPTLAGTLSSLPPDLAGPGFVEPPTTTTTTRSPPATTTTTRAEPEPPPLLEEMVPGLEGTMQLAFPELGEVWRWRSGDPFPERRPLPAGTVHAGFDASGGWTAALALPDNRLRPGGGLFLAGPDLAFQPFEAGVIAFHWHPTEPGRLAWTKVGLDGGAQLWTGPVPGPADDLRMVAELGHVDDGPGLFLSGWGDWGFLLAGLTDSGDVELVVFDLDGRRRASRTTDLVALRADGTMLVSDSRQPDGSPAGLGLTTPDLGEPEPVDWDVRFPAVWAAGAGRLATVVPAGVGAVLEVLGEGAFQTVLDTQQAFPVGWVLGDRFLVVWADGVRTRFSSDPEASRQDREVRRPALVFLDVADRSISAIAVEQFPADIAFRVAS